MLKFEHHWICKCLFLQNGERNAKPSGLHLHVYRKFTKLEDKSTYVFSITSKMKYKNNHGYKNFSFTCSSIQHPNCLQSTLYTSSLPNESINSKGKGIISHSTTSISVTTGLTSANKSGIRVNIIAPSSWGDESINGGKLAEKQICTEYKTPL